MENVTVCKKCFKTRGELFRLELIGHEPVMIYLCRGCQYALQTWINFLGEQTVQVISSERFLELLKKELGSPSTDGGGERPEKITKGANDSPGKGPQRPRTAPPAEFETLPNATPLTTPESVA